MMEGFNENYPQHELLGGKGMLRIQAYKHKSTVGEGPQDDLADTGQSCKSAIPILGRERQDGKTFMA